MEHTCRHQCLIYTGAPSEQLAAIGATLIQKLKAGFRCIYINSPVMVSGLRSYLAAAGLDLKEVTDRGALILSSDQTHLKEGLFEVAPMIALLRTAALRSQADGYVGLWASGDMTWEFGSEKNLDKLLEYEVKLEELFQEIPAFSGICQYHMDTLPPDAVRTALSAHRSVFINESLSKLNPNYVPPKRAAHERVKCSHSELQEMLEGLGLAPFPIKARVVV